ncbi:MAG: hypothetical protein M3Y13_08895 [Armatimonadota bacterium]|nr:hypothetical protein [Armatimonadota bacterium]
MQKKLPEASTEVLLGAGMIVVGLTALALGDHDLFAQALAPFGFGLIISDGATRAAKKTTERVRARLRRPDNQAK